MDFDEHLGTDRDGGKGSVVSLIFGVPGVWLSVLRWTLRVVMVGKALIIPVSPVYWTMVSEYLRDRDSHGMVTGLFHYLEELRCLWLLYTS